MNRYIGSEWITDFLKKRIFNIMASIGKNISFMWLLGLLIVVAACYFYFQNNTVKPANVVEKKGVLNEPKDTIGKYVPIVELEKEKENARYWRGRFNALIAEKKAAATPKYTDSDSALLRITPMERDSVIVVLDSSDSSMDDIIMPYSVPIEDKTSINYLTVRPLESKDKRVRLDSTIYKQDGVSVRVPITAEDCKEFEDSWLDHWETKVAGTVLFLASVASIFL